MQFVFFTHSLRSDWNHGNAHFLRGIVTDLSTRGHEVRVLEPARGWSAENLRRDHGNAALVAYREHYPRIQPRCYDPVSLDLDAVLAGADVVVVHEWSPPELVRAVGDHRRRVGTYILFFHDTHHRSATDPRAIAAYDLSAYDAVLAFGEVVQRIYLRERWARQCFVWHEAADTRVFYPRASGRLAGDLVWIGNWGDEERTRELREFLIDPVRALGLNASVYGVRYPQGAIDLLGKAGIRYGGYLPNHRVPEVFGRYRVTVHVPRRVYADKLPGIPTIRPFEALACGIPLVTAPWHDIEGMFTPGQDLLPARDGAEMVRQLRRVLSHPEIGRGISRCGRETIAARHTCVHRVDELLRICRAVRTQGARATTPSAVQKGAPQ